MGVPDSEGVAVVIDSEGGGVATDGVVLPQLASANNVNKGVTTLISARIETSLLESSLSVPSLIEETYL